MKVNICRKERKYSKYWEHSISLFQKLPFIIRNFTVTVDCIISSALDSTGTVALIDAHIFRLCTKIDILSKEATKKTIIQCKAYCRTRNMIRSWLLTTGHPSDYGIIEWHTCRSWFGCFGSKFVRETETKKIISSLQMMYKTYSGQNKKINTGH